MQLLIQGCKKNDYDSQRLLYKHYYVYALTICRRYCIAEEDAREVVNDGFLKVFKKIDQYQMETSFKGWLRRIMINTSIDRYRSERKHYFHEEVSKSMADVKSENKIFSDLTNGELLDLIKLLSPAYRAVFNLYVIDGYTHREIAELLSINEGTSKSNLAKARENLKALLNKFTDHQYAKSV